MNRKRLTCALVGLSLLATPLLAYDKLSRKVDDARLAYRELLGEADRVVPHRLVSDASCIAVFPNVVKGAFGWGGRYGKGVLTCRNEGGEWSPPIFLKIWGASFGLQIGGTATDLILFFMTERSARALLRSKFTLGGDVSVAAGPQGRTAEAITDVTLRAEVYSYAKSRGLFAGIALDGARVAPSQKALANYYGERLWPDKVLFEHQVPKLPAEARQLMDALP